MLPQNNFKFKQLLEESWLNIAEKYDISNIFNCLSDSRKIEIIDSWPYYLNQILKIRNETQEKRRENIFKALENINNIVNEAILRQKDEQEKKQKEAKELNEINKNASLYDQLKRVNNLQNLINKQYDKS